PARARRADRGANPTGLHATARVHAVRGARIAPDPGAAEAVGSRARPERAADDGRDGGVRPGVPHAVVPLRVISQRALGEAVDELADVRIAARLRLVCRTVE